MLTPAGTPIFQFCQWLGLPMGNILPPHEEHYTSANDAGNVGLECDQTCEVLQFTVVAQ
jgi:hypothetical protein